MTHRIHGFAIVSDDDRIADATGAVPDVLRNDADWAYFQEWLDRAGLTVLGRLGHEANPNIRGRNRLILSSAARGLERRTDGLWWNPADIAVAEALETALPGGGLVAVPGGRRVFDLFLSHGYDAFHLSRAHGSALPGGIALFSGLGEGERAEDRLERHGLRAAPATCLDAANNVSLTMFKRR